MNAAARRSSRPGKPLSADDVHRRLPLIRAIAGDIVRLHRDLADRRDRLARIHKLPGGNREVSSLYAEEREQIERDIQHDDETLQGFIIELESLSGVLRDADVGRIEFAGELDGSNVFFGWLFGDEDLSYWRLAESDDTERHPLLQGTASREDDADVTS